MLKSNTKVTCFTITSTGGFCINTMRVGGEKGGEIKRYRLHSRIETSLLLYSTVGGGEFDVLLLLCIISGGVSIYGTVPGVFH